MRMLTALADRTAVLFLGLAAGAAIGFAFGRSGERAVPRVILKPPPRTAATPAGQRPAARVAAAPELSLPFQPHLLDTVAAGKPVTVGVFGDSFGDGVWSALYRLLPAKEHFRVLKFSQESTGFTRYASLNLEDRAQAQLADGPVDIAVISFGANDTQGVYSGGHARALMSPEWQQVIGERVDRFVALLRSRGAMVYWVGLPKMRKDSFDEDISSMNQFYTERMKALGVPFIDIKPLTVDAGGEYAPYLPDPLTHERRLMRANDGIHMSMNGYVVISRALAGRIKTYVAVAQTNAVGRPAAVPVVLPAVVAPPMTEEKRSEHIERRHDHEKKHDEAANPDKSDDEHKDKPVSEAGDIGNKSSADAPAKPEHEARDGADRPKRDAADSDKSRIPERREGEAKDKAAAPPKDKPSPKEKSSGERHERDTKVKSDATPKRDKSSDHAKHDDRIDAHDRRERESGIAKAVRDVKPKTNDAPNPRKREDGDAAAPGFSQ